MIRSDNALGPVAVLFAAVAVGFIGLSALSGCATTRDFVAPAYRDNPASVLPDGEVAFRVFLTGNTADVSRGGSEAVLTAMAADARAAGEASAVVLLGDETLAGVPEGDATEALQPVEALGRALRGYPGRVVVLPGDRDWRQGRAGVKRLEDALIRTLGDSVLTPGDQAGGPRSIELADGLRLFAIDTAWWLRDDRPEGEFDGENVRSPADVATYLEQQIADRDDDRIVVVGHHPILSNGPYAGQRTFGQAALSLGVGPLVGQTVGTSPQSLAQHDYRRMRGVLDRLFAQHDRLTYVSSHDRALETFDVVRSEINRQTYLVSGTGGGRASAAAHGRGAAHVLPAPGYQRLVYYLNGSLWSETVRVDAATGETTVAFRTELAGADRERIDPDIPETTPADIPLTVGTRVTVAPDALFLTGPFRNDAFTRSVWGSGYRDVWETPVMFPVLDLGTEAGGLVPLKLTGGNQTTGLRLQGADGREYGLRLIEKGGIGQLPAELREGIAASVVLDLRSAQTPYGAIVAYPLSRAAGVLITRPRLVYVPDDPRLGRYRSRFADQIALLDVRADEDMRGVEGFDGVTDVVSDSKLREELREDQDHRVDQRAFLRARLVDMLIADWDRHEGQWRWAAYEPGDLDTGLTGGAATRGKVYRPVAKDHDFAFYGIGGVAPYLLRRFADERLQGFAESFGSVRGLTANGFEQDRRFFNTLTREDMQAVAAEVQQMLSDATLDAAVRALPSPVYAQVGDEWTRTLRWRRDHLGDLVDDLYELHVGIVDVIGSDEREVFTADHRADGSLNVVVRSGKDGKDDRVLYERTFSPRETHEVRLYGFGGRDVFHVVGADDDEVQVRIIGGGGRDSLLAPAGEVMVYDTPGGLQIAELGGGIIRDRRSDDGGVNRYDPTENVLRRSQIVPTLGYNPTNGLLIGGAWMKRVPGFRLNPVAATHVVSANVAVPSGGLDASYRGRMREALFRVDLDVDALASTPRYTQNFYGFGNAAPDLPNDLEQVDVAQVHLDAGLGGPLGQGLRLVGGPSVRYDDVSRGDTTGSAVDALALVRPDVYSPQTHAGAFARLMLETSYGGVNPVQGLDATITGAYRAGLTGGAGNYGQLGAEARAYFPVNYAPQLTLALRAGAEHRFGDFPFFDAATVGGPSTLRGFRRQRFSGRTAAYSGAEARAKLFRLDTYALPFTVGVIGFADAGRVWADDRPSACSPGAFCPQVVADPDDGSALHVGYGGGLFFNALNRAIATVTVGHSTEATLVNFGAGFSF